MIREFKLDKKDKLGGNSKNYDARKKHQKKAKKQSIHLKQIIHSKSSKKTKKNNQHMQKGGNFKKRDKFEVTTLDNVDCSKFSVSQYVNANIDWGLMPGPPPTDCCVM